MTAPMAMVANQRPTIAASVGPPPLNGVHSPSAPLKCPAVHRAPGGRNGEASTSGGRPLSKTHAPSAAAKRRMRAYPGAQSIPELWASAKESRRAAHHSSSPEPQSQDASVPLPAGRFSTLQEAQSSPSCPSRHVLFKPPRHAAPGVIESPPARSREGADSHGHTRVRLAPALSAP